MTAGALVGCLDISALFRVLAQLKVEMESTFVVDDVLVICWINNRPKKRWMKHLMKPTKRNVYYYIIMIVCEYK